MAVTTGSSTIARSVASGVTTNLSAAITGPANSFNSRDQGAPITGTGIPAGTTVLTVTSGTAATITETSPWKLRALRGAPEGTRPCPRCWPGFLTTTRTRLRTVL